MANISKAELVRELSDTTGLSQKDTKTVVEGLVERVTHHLKAGD